FFRNATGTEQHTLSLKMSEFCNAISNESFYRDQISQFDWYPEFEAFRTYSQFTNKDKQLKGIVPIVLAADDNYAIYLSVTIQSIIENRDLRKNYNIYIFYTDISDRYRKLWIEQGNKYDNINIIFLNVSCKIAIASLYSRAHYSKEMYYRLLIPEILCMYEK